MKKICSLLLAGSALLSVTSCSDSDYDDKYADPSKTNSVAVAQAFTGVLYKGNTWMNPMYYRNYVQMSTDGIFSGVLGDDNTRGRFMGAGVGRYDDRWKNFYDMVTQYRLLEYNYNNLPESEKASNTVMFYVGRTLVEAQLHEMLSLFGDVPFNGAGTLWMDGDYEAAKAKCVYDDDVVLYKQILNNLKEVADYFAGDDVDAIGLKALSRQDYTVAAGDATKWRKYVNSLRLRIALHLSTAGECATEAHQVIAEVLGNPAQYPVIESNDENMGVKADTQTDEFNFGKSISQALHNNNGASQTMLRVMNLPANGIPDKNTDPRIQAMYDCNPEGAYIAFDVTKTNAEITDLGEKKKQEYIQAGIMNANYYCKLDTQAVAGWAEYQGNEHLFGLWIGAAEVSLSKAEAYLMGYGVSANAALAKENFIKGVELSCEYYWNQKENSTLFKAGNDSYYGLRNLSRPSTDEITTYAESIWEPTQKAICSQLWLNFSYLNQLEAWNVVRRTGYPEVTFATDNQISNYPTPPNRLPYPNDELSYNSVNCQNAIAKNYEEPTGFYTNLFWSQKTYYKIVK